MRKVEQCLDEAVRIAGPDLDFADYYWTRGLLARFRGEYAAALDDLERVLGHNRRDGRNWDVCICINDIVLVGLESGRPELVLRYTPELIEIASKVGDGALQHAAAACDAIARIRLASAAADASDAWSSLDAALGRVRDADGKLMLATCANFAAELALAGARAGRALDYASEALAAAAAVRNRSQSALARAIVVRATTACGDAGAAAEHLSRLESESQHVISARARAAVALARAKSAVGTS